MSLQDTLDKIHSELVTEEKALPPGVRNAIETIDLMNASDVILGRTLPSPSSSGVRRVVVGGTINHQDFLNADGIK
ncbi:hypothetical protein HYV64_01420 [Candidatus Shapirobacteria bacterium]|nr:hypothetical protein [Candidatus Shapirobacteria bacterium]